MLSCFVRLLGGFLNDFSGLLYIYSPSPRIDFEDILESLTKAHEAVLGGGSPVAFFFGKEFISYPGAGLVGGIFKI